MHIPDGFLGPGTCIATFAVTVPVLYYCWHRARTGTGFVRITRIGSTAAFVFLLMMLNIPVPGGTTAHATGAALAAILLGPALGILAVSLALFMQALLFADGGVTAYGANCLAMAITECTIAYLIWNAGTRMHAGSPRSFSVFSFAAGYLAAVAGSLVTSILLGLQPFLEHSAGRPLYFPIPLAVTVPAIAGAHLITGLLEGMVTMAAVRAARMMPEFHEPHGIGEAGRSTSGRTWVSYAIIAMLVLAPLGLLLPWLAGSSAPWGEWSPAETARIAGLSETPAGMSRLSSVWKAPVPDYMFVQSSSRLSESAQYVGAAFMGVGATILVCLVIYHLQQRRERRTRVLRSQHASKFEGP